MPRNYTDLSKDISSTEDTSSNQTKTTDINILLNRVRLDKKKTLRKNIFFTLLAVILVCAITIFLII